MTKNDQKIYIEALNGFIKEGEELEKLAKPTKKEPDLSTIQESRRLEKWLNDIENLVKVIASNSSYTDNIAEYKKGKTYYPSQVSKFIACLDSLKEAIEKGYLQNVEFKILKIVAADVLTDAEELNNSGYLQAAAISMRVAVEQQLKALAAQNGIKQNQTSDKIREELLTKNIISNYKSSEIQSWIQAGNAAAHSTGNMPIKSDIQTYITNIKTWLNNGNNIA
jgi:hypothetical protein